jgi:hypothetical protein
LRRNSSNNTPQTANAIVKSECRDLGPAGVESPPPFREHARVGKTECFVAHQPQSGPLELLLERGLGRQAPAWKYIALNEINRPAVIVEVLFSDGDHLKDRPAARLGAARDLAEIGRPPGFADSCGSAADRIKAAMLWLAVLVALMLRRRDSAPAFDAIWHPTYKERRPGDEGVKDQTSERDSRGRR